MSEMSWEYSGDVTKTVSYFTDDSQEATYSDQRHIKAQAQLIQLSFKYRKLQNVLNKWESNSNQHIYITFLRVTLLIIVAILYKQNQQDTDTTNNCVNHISITQIQTLIIKHDAIYIGVSCIIGLVTYLTWANLLQNELQLDTQQVGLLIGYTFGLGYILLCLIHFSEIFGSDASVTSLILIVPVDATMMMSLLDLLFSIKKYQFCERIMLWTVKIIQIAIKLIIYVITYRLEIMFVTGVINCFIFCATIRVTSTFFLFFVLDIVLPIFIHRCSLFCRLYLTHRVTYKTLKYRQLYEIEETALPFIFNENYHKLANGTSLLYKLDKDQFEKFKPGKGHLNDKLYEWDLFVQSRFLLFYLFIKFIVQHKNIFTTKEFVSKLNENYDIKGKYGIMIILDDFKRFLKHRSQKDMMCAVLQINLTMENFAELLNSIRNVTKAKMKRHRYRGKLISIIPQCDEKYATRVYKTLTLLHKSTKLLVTGLF